MNANDSTIFIVDDDERSRNSVRAMVVTMGLKAVTFTSAEEFLDAYTGDGGCLVSDLRMPGRGGVELLKALEARNQMLPTIVISAYAEVPVAVEIMQHGAVTLLEKPYRENEMWNAIREALRRNRESRVSREERQLISERMNRLTESESAVLKLVLEGIPNKAIAGELKMSIRTVESRRQGIFEKMHVDSVARLVQDVMVANDGHRPSVDPGQG